MPRTTEPVFVTRLGDEGRVLMISAARSSGGGLDELAIPRLQGKHPEQNTMGMSDMYRMKKPTLDVRGENPGDSRDGLRPHSGGYRFLS